MGQATFIAAGVVPLVFSVNPVYPGKTTIYSGSVSGQTEGGDEYVYEKGVPYVLIELRFEGLSASDFDGSFNYSTKVQTPDTQSLVNWYINVFGATRRPFTYRDPFGGEHSVNIFGDRLDFALSDYGLYNGQIVLKQKLG
jgi:hypothetical protein